MAVITNECTRPSFENATLTPFISNGGGVVTLSRSTDQALYGTNSLKVVSNGAAANQGWQTSKNVFTAVPNDYVTASCSLYGSGTLHFVIIGVRADGITGTTDNVTTVVGTISSSWQRVQATLLLDDPLTAFYAVRCYTSGSEAVTFYTDGVMFEKANAISDYFDGDTTDTAQYRYDWTGTAHASSSTKTPLSNATLRRIRNQFQLRPY